MCLRLRNGLEENRSEFFETMERLLDKHLS